MVEHGGQRGVIGILGLGQPNVGRPSAPPHGDQLPHGPVVEDHQGAGAPVTIVSKLEFRHDVPLARAWPRGKPGCGTLAAGRWLRYQPAYHGPRAAQPPPASRVISTMVWRKPSRSKNRCAS